MRLASRRRRDRSQPRAANPRPLLTAPIAGRVAATAELRLNASDHGARPTRRPLPTPALLALHQRLGQALRARSDPLRSRDVPRHPRGRPCSARKICRSRAIASTIRRRRPRERIGDVAVARLGHGRPSRERSLPAEPAASGLRLVHGCSRQTIRLGSRGAPALAPNRVADSPARGRLTYPFMDRVGPSRASASQRRGAPGSDTSTILFAATPSPPRAGNRTPRAGEVAVRPHGSRAIASLPSRSRGGTRRQRSRGSALNGRAVRTGGSLLAAGCRPDPRDRTPARRAPPRRRRSRTPPPLRRCRSHSDE